MMRDDIAVVEEVRAVNQGFYRALESLDIQRMDAVWAHDGQLTCVHPGWPLAEGWAGVRATWLTIFQNTVSIEFEVVEERIDVRGDMAWVLCVERLRSSADGTEFLEAAVLATNIFRHEGGAWLLVHHHASPWVPPDPTLLPRPPSPRLVH